MTHLDVQGRPLQIGDRLCFTSAPNALNVGTLTGFKTVMGRTILCEIVVDLSDGRTHTITVQPHATCKLQGGIS